jgi:site-specific recombinase XerD
MSRSYATLSSKHLQRLDEHVPPQGSGNKRLVHGADMAKVQELLGHGALAFI